MRTGGWWFGLFVL